MTFHVIMIFCENLVYKFSLFEILKNNKTKRKTKLQQRNTKKKKMSI